MNNNGFFSSNNNQRQSPNTFGSSVSLSSVPAPQLPAYYAAGSSTTTYSNVPAVANANYYSANPQNTLYSQRVVVRPAPAVMEVEPNCCKIL